MPLTAGTGMVVEEEGGRGVSEESEDDKGGCGGMRCAIRVLSAFREERWTVCGNHWMKKWETLLQLGPNCNQGKVK